MIVFTILGFTFASLIFYLNALKWTFGALNHNLSFALIGIILIGVISLKENHNFFHLANFQVACLAFITLLGQDIILNRLAFYTALFGISYQEFYTRKEPVEQALFGLFCVICSLGVYYRNNEKESQSLSLFASVWLAVCAYVLTTQPPYDFYNVERAFAHFTFSLFFLIFVHKKIL